MSGKARRGSSRVSMEEADEADDGDGDGDGPDVFFFQAPGCNGFLHVGVIFVGLASTPGSVIASAFFVCSKVKVVSVDDGEDVTFAPLVFVYLVAVFVDLLFFSYQGLES